MTDINTMYVQQVRNAVKAEGELTLEYRKDEQGLDMICYEGKFKTAKGAVAEVGGGFHLIGPIAWPMLGEVINTQIEAGLAHLNAQGL